MKKGSIKKGLTILVTILSIFLFNTNNVKADISLIGQSQDFSCTQTIQPFTATVSGVYKLEVWGAQGGSASKGKNGVENNNYTRGYGGYSVGNINMASGDTVYVVVGCSAVGSAYGGYNGGGNGTIWASAGHNQGYGGGGATHISRTNTLLRNTPVSDLLIAAGGGGGGNDQYNTTQGPGANAGGYKGNAISTTITNGTGGTQTGPGACGYQNANMTSQNCSEQGGYGYGASAEVSHTDQSMYKSYGAGGGGGGYYGGGAGYVINGNSGQSFGGGGSGYIGNSALSDKHMACIACEASDAANTKTINLGNSNNNASSGNVSTSAISDRVIIGHGAARITLVSEIPDGRLKMLKVTGTTTDQTLISSPTGDGEYNVTLDKYETSVNITAQSVSPNSSISLTSPVSTPAGTTTTYVYSTASDGTVLVYKINLYRPVNDISYATDLTYNGTTIPGFNRDTLEYTINQSSFDETKTFELGASLYSSNQLVTGLGTYNYEFGTHDYEITVTSEDRTATRTYTIHVVKAHTTRLKLIELDNHTLSPTFNRDTLNYTTAIGTVENSLGIKKMIPYDESVDINSTGHKFIRFDQNGLIKITVTHPNAEETVYTINALRDGLVKNGKWGFGCTGHSEIWTVPETRYYVLEAWGAQGGESGGRGGYTSSKVKLTEGQEIYVTVGCQGQNASNGGYNGGGSGTAGAVGSPDGGHGGGATHFAINNNLGELKKFNRNKSDVLIVAGGGGGANHKDQRGGAGGGLNGIAGDGDFSGTGGGQSGGGSGKGWIITGGNGSFGQGGNASSVNVSFIILFPIPKYAGGGGGGGWYGGGGGDTSLFGNSGGGGGGSSYINTNSGLKTKATTTIDGNSSMPTYQGGYTIGKTGDGYATITQAEYPSNNNNLKRLSILATDETTLNETKKNYTPVLDGTTTDYYVHLESNETKVDLDAEVEDGDAEILSGLGTYFVDGSEKTVTITVKADNGDVKEYKIHFDRDLDNNSKPLDIKIEGLVPNYCSQSNLYCNLTPTFNPDTNEYEMFVPGRIDTLKFVVEKAHKNQSVTGDGSVYLAEEENVINIRVTSEDGTSSTTYRYVITRDLDGSPYLETINVLDPDTDLGFSKNVFDYYITVPNEYDKYVDNLVNEKNNSLENTLQLYIKPESDHTSYTLSGNGNLNFGNNKLTITTTARNGEVAIYNITVYRSKDISTLLSTLKVYNGEEEVELIPEYNKLKYNYRGEVDETVETVNIVATPEDNRSTVTGDGIQVLSAGKNRFIVTITSPAGDSESYVINITKKKENNSYLSSLVVKNGEEELTYTPEFNKETYEYELQVESDVNKLDIIGTPESDRASVINLTDTVIKVGNNKKTIYCYAEDGTYKTYTVNITKKSPLANRLSDIKVYDKDNNELEYTPEFNPETFVYSLTVDNDIDSVKVEGTKTNPKSVLKGNGTYALEVGMNPVHLLLTIEGEEPVTYSILINRKGNNNAYLDSITLSEGTLSPSFDKETVDYAVNIDSDITSISIEGIPEVISTTVTGNGEYMLSSGDNEIELVTLAEDGTTLTYTITVKKKLSDNNNIKSLILKESDLTPEFDPSTTSYDAYVPNEVTSGTFIVELEDPNATYEIIGNENFKEGNNEVTIRVTSESNKTKDYVVNINRQASSTSNYLASLTVSEGTLTPEFDKTIQYYEVEVESDIETIIVEATPEYASSTVEGTGLLVLEKGQNRAVVRVTDKNGIIRDYQVIITRKGNNEARLKTLELNSEILSPAFDKDTYSYSTSTASTSLEFNKIETLDENATYEVKNNVFTDEGEYTVTIEVTAEDGVTKKNYDITVTKTASDNNNLSYLAVEGYEIVPEYDKGIIVYTLTVPSDVNMVNVIAKAEDSNATITGDGLNRLDVGENNVFVRVTSQSGKTKSYTITITREGSSNNKLKALDVLNGTFSPTYSNNIYEYNSEIPYEENIADIYYELEDENAKVSIEGNEDLKEGLNEVVMTVTATNGDVRVIELHVTKKPPVSSLLKTLKVVGYETTPEFNSYRMNYEVDVNNETDDLDLIIETLDPNATYVVSDTSLEVGSNEVTIEVTASDGVTKSTYTISVNRDEYANNYLLYLFTNRGDLTPTFNATTNEYSINVANDIEDIDIIAKAENTTATVTTPNPTINTDTYDGLVGRFALQTGENKIHILVTTEEASTRRYIITVNRAKKDDNYLKTLKVYHEGNAYDLVPEFNKETTSYTVSVPTNVENVVITGTPHDETATVTGLGEKQVHFGANTFPVVVTAENGSTKTYTLVVNRALSSNNNLFLLEPSSGELDPVFEEDVTEYNLELDDSVSTLWFDYIAEDKYSTVEGTEEQVVPDGTSVREIIVTAENGDEKTYTVNVIKQRKDNAYLDDLYVVDYPFVNNSGETVTFDKDVFDYTIKVPYSKATLHPNEVVYESEDENATVEKDNVLNLYTDKDNIYKVKVTAADGFTTRIYTIHVERGKNNNALLSSFEAKVGELNIGFIPTTFEYVWTLPENKEITPLDVTYTLMDENAKATPTESVTYVEGEDNAFEIEVTSEDGTVTNTYRFVLELNTNEKPYLKSLTADIGTLTPTFDKETYTYDLYEYEDVESVTLSAEAEDPTSTVEGTGLVTLSSDFTKREIVVTGTNGETTKYIVNIHKVVPRNDHLDDLGLNGLENLRCSNVLCVLTPTFDPSVTTYEIKVPKEYDKLDVYYKLNNDHQTVEITVDGNPYVKGMDLTEEETEVVVKVYNGLNELAATYTMTVLRKDVVDIITPEEEIPVPKGDEYELPTNTIPKDSENAYAVTFKRHNGEEDIIKYVTKEFTPNGWLINGVHYDDGDTITPEDDVTLVPDYIETYGGVEFPSNPRKEKYAFNGWYDQETGGNQYTSYNEPEEFTLHAQYTDDYVVITIPGEEPEPVPKGEEYEIPINDKTKETVTTTVTFKPQNGEEDIVRTVTKTYTPNGWLINDVHYDDGDIITPTEDITLVPDYIETITGTGMEFPEDPEKESYAFTGWFDQEENGTEYNSYDGEEDLTLYAQYVREFVTISFDSHEGPSVDSVTKAYNSELGSLPEITRDGYILDGWYKESTYENKVSSKTKATDDMTLHAKWVEDPFPIVYEDDEEEFDGTNYLNTHIRLYSEENASKDYEIGFTIEEFDESIQEKYATFTQDMYELEETGYPGLVVRFDNRDNIFKTDIRHNRNSQDDYGSVYVDNYPVIKKVRIVRKDGVIYYSTNDGELAVLHNFNNFTNYFETEATFGAALDENNSPFRFIKGKLSNMYVRLGDYPEKEYDYTGEEETFIAPQTGYYRLETWGAQGGSINDTYVGGYGAYSTGIVRLNKDEKVYINVGGQGSFSNTTEITGGYNGGGSANGGLCPAAEDYRPGASGGGATHIATQSGLLSTLENNRDSILIVSGGGGASNNYGGIGNGGSAGGIKGNTATYTLNLGHTLEQYATGGTQTSGGTGGNSFNETISGLEGSFGQGGNALNVNCNEGNGGGSGYYGGGASKFVPSAGGSGYIGNTILTSNTDTTKHMTCYNCETSDAESTKTISNTCHSAIPTEDCSKGGNGYAKITYIPETHTVTYPDGNIEVYEHNTIVNLDSNESTKDSEELAIVTFDYNNNYGDYEELPVTKEYIPNGFSINGVHYDDQSTLLVDEDKVITYSYEEKIGVEFPTIEREYCTFDGWYTDPDGGEKVESYDGDENITLYAHWIHETVTITYPDEVVEVNKGEEYQVKYNENEIGPDVATVTFKYHNGEDDTASEVITYYYSYGWKDNNNDTYWNYDYIYPTEDLVLNPVNYVDYTTYAEFPENPTREGYAFLGWFTEEEGGEKITSYDNPESITLHAQWTKDFVTITTPGEVINVPRGEEYDLPWNTYSKDDEILATVTFKLHNGEDDIVRNVTKNYTVNGWLIDGVHFDSDTTIIPTKDITLVPDYTYSIQEARFPDNPTKENEHFLGWFDEEEGGNKYTSYSEEEDIILHAQYKEGTYAYLMYGGNVKQLFEDTNLYFSRKHFRKATLEEYNEVKDDLTKVHVISDYHSPMPAYLWTTSDAIVYYSEADTIYMNESSRTFFYNTEFSSYDLSGLDTSKVKDFTSMFGQTRVSTLDLSSWDTSSATVMSGMFYGNENLTTIILGDNFNTSKVWGMDEMFYGCTNLESIDLSHFDTSSATNMSGMFKGCKKITSLDVSNFDTSKVTNMGRMFSDCTSLTSIDISHFDVQNVTDFREMFKGSTNLETIVWSNYVNNKATNLSNMFSGLSNIKEIDISNINVKKAGYITINDMFKDSPNLETIYANKDAWPVIVRNSSTSSNLFTNDTSLVGGEGTVYDSNNTNYSYALVDDPDNGNPGYFTDVSTIKEQHTVTYHYRNGDVVEHYNHNSMLNLGVNDTEISLDNLGTVTFKYHDGVTEDTKRGAFAISTPNGWLVNDVHYDDSSLITIDEDKDVYYDSIVITDIDDFPENPTRDRYQFLGWFTEEEGGEKVESYEGEEDIVLHAHWEETSLPTDLDIDVDDVTIVVGETHQIGVTFIPDGTEDTLTYTGYDNELVDVTNDGLITALSKGETTITVGTENTDITKTITVTVISDLLESDVYTVANKEKEDQSIDRIIIGAEPGTTIQEFKENMLNPVNYIKIYDQDNNELSEDDIVKTGLTIKLEINGIVHDEATIIIRGDINQDGLVNLMDKSVLSEQLLRLSDIEGYGVYAADIDNNGSINLMDKSKLSEYLLRLIDTLNE